MATDFKPVSGNVLPRYAGIPTFMRLPHVPLDHADISQVDVGLIGVPWDGGTTNRAGARHGPRQLRDISTMMRNYHHVTGVGPYQLSNCADLGDSPVNPIDLEDALKRVEAFYTAAHAHGITPLSAGGDHLVTLPIMRAIARDRPVGMVHFDAHTDTWDRYFGDYTYTPIPMAPPSAAQLKMAYWIPSGPFRSASAAVSTARMTTGGGRTGHPGCSN